MPRTNSCMCTLGDVFSTALFTRAKPICNPSPHQQECLRLNGRKILCEKAHPKRVHRSIQYLVKSKQLTLKTAL